MIKLEEALKRFPEKDRPKLRKCVKEVKGKVVVDWGCLNQIHTVSGWQQELKLLMVLGKLSTSSDGNYSVTGARNILNPTIRQGTVYFIEEEDARDYGHAFFRLLYKTEVVKGIPQTKSSI